MANGRTVKMDSELFELCKEVYKRTEWQPTGYFDGDYVVTQEDADAGGYDDGQLKSLYTSDYLLEKLPKFSPFAKDAYLTVIEKQVPKDKREDFYWTAGYFTGYGWGHTGQSDTPLKALLKLTIALHEAGELK